MRSGIPLLGTPKLCRCRVVAWRETPWRTSRPARSLSLAYTHYGDPNGQPVMYFHGWPGSRLEAELVSGEARTAGALVIAVDRPGMGGSDFQRGRRLLDWADDVVALADALQLERFAVLGVSGGGPYALACAHAIPQRVSAAATV